MQIKTWQIQIIKWKIMFKQAAPALWLQKYSKVIKKLYPLSTMHSLKAICKHFLMTLSTL